MLPVYSPDSHSHYQDFFISNFLKYYPDPFSISRQTWKVIIQFWHMDLSETPNILMDSYSKFGPLPRDPASMLRSYLLSIKLKWQMKYGLGVNVVPSQKLAMLQYEFYDKNGQFIDMKENNENL